MLRTVMTTHVFFFCFASELSPAKLIPTYLSHLWWAAQIFGGLNVGFSLDTRTSKRAPHSTDRKSVFPPPVTHTTVPLKPEPRSPHEHWELQNLENLDHDARRTVLRVVCQMTERETRAHPSTPEKNVLEA